MTEKTVREALETKGILKGNRLVLVLKLTIVVSLAILIMYLLFRNPTATISVAGLLLPIFFIFYAVRGFGGRDDDDDD